MSQELSNSVIDSIVDAKKHVLFNQSTQNAKFYKYLSGDKIVYDYYAIHDPTAPSGATYEYSQIYLRNGTVFITAPFLNAGEILSGFINASGITVDQSSTFLNHLNIVTGGLHVTGNVSFNENLFIRDNLSASGNTTFGGNLTVFGKMDISGFSTFSHGMFIQNGINISEAFNITLNNNSLNIESINRTGTINLGSRR